MEYIVNITHRHGAKEEIVVSEKDVASIVRRHLVEYYAKKVKIKPKKDERKGSDDE